jgi:hypothetical protein
MPYQHFNAPTLAERHRPVLVLPHWWGGIARRRQRALCARPGTTRHRPARGRLRYWEREPGVDDIAWQPMLDVAPLKPRA